VAAAAAAHWQEQISAAHSILSRDPYDMILLELVCSQNTVITCGAVLGCIPEVAPGVTQHSTIVVMAGQAKNVWGGLALTYCLTSLHSILTPSHTNNT
jgi:diphthamide synthase subunit DPH2